ncbi:phosphatidylinositol synthase 1 (CDP-alcohol phosphatidyltransferase1) [Diatrype stigma]|uniref:Phosphatidylinositol synthase 1 (CDP-alcohol phosphatidyltransferase1) n=1 Tax=Diatrype stigma TaxID=117547 RepID=A0AAN9YNQ6_9PEZI
MSERRTRRQAALASAASNNEAETPTKATSTSDAPINGNSVGKDDNAVLADKSRVTTPGENIFLFWPNVIDGYAARYFQQSTRFGAVLDMVTDRCTTSCLLVFLSSAFPRWAIVFQSLISVDFASHYIHMYATLAMGGSDTSHKSVDKSRSWLLNLYYTNKAVLFTCCALNEVFFIGLYLLSFSSPLLSPQLLSTVGESKAAAIQQGAQLNSSTLRQLFTNPYSAAALELARANKMDSFWPWVITGISFPVMAIKQILNIVQLVKASRWLAEGDVEARKAAGLPKKQQ